MSNQPGQAVPGQGGHLYHYPQDQQQFGQYPSYPQYTIQQSQPTIGFQPQLVGQNHPAPYYPQQPFPAPIQQQPTGGLFSNAEFSAYLRNSTSFHVKQKVELFEAILGWETGNKYTVNDSFGNKIFFVGEETGCLTRICCGVKRPFELAVKDTRGVDVLRFSRPIDCNCCCGLLCPDSVTVSTTSGQKVGTVIQDFSIIGPKFTLRNATDQAVLRLNGPPCIATFGFCGSIEFILSTMDGNQVGTITKKWSGLGRELFTDTDFFSMSFPIDLDPEMKATCLAALFLIDFEYFEKSGN